MSGFLDQVLNADAIPVLQRAVQFSARRHEVIAHNIANLSTPGYQPVEAPVESFRRSLGEAIDRRRQGGPTAGLDIRPTRDVRVSASGDLALRPRPGRGSVLYHDRNNRDLERSMQDLAENAGAFRVSSELLKSRFALIDAAIRLRV